MFARLPHALDLGLNRIGEDQEPVPIGPDWSTGLQDQLVGLAFG